MAETPALMYMLATILTVLALIATVLRFYARYIKKAGFSWDDYLIVPAILFTFGTAMGMIIGSAKGDLARHTLIGNDGYPIFTHRTIIFEQIAYASQLTTILTFAFTKLAVLLFYKRVFKGALFKAGCWTLIGIVIIWGVAFFIACALQCYPISMNWTLYGAMNGVCVNTNALILAQAYSDVFTDIVILLLPLPCIWTLQMPVKHRLAVCGIFLTGALTVGAGIAKLVAFRWTIEQTNGNNLDITFIDTPLIYWPMVESSLGIVGACLPLLRPLFAGKSKGPVVVRKFTPVVIPIVDEGEEAWRRDLESSEKVRKVSNTAFSKFGSAGSLPPYQGDNAHIYLSEKDLPKLPEESVERLSDDTDRNFVCRAEKEHPRSCK